MKEEKARERPSADAAARAAVARSGEEEEPRKEKLGRPGNSGKPRPREEAMEVYLAILRLRLDSGSDWLTEPVAVRIPISVSTK